MSIDIVLSSGFLAFARQAGFLAAVEQSGIDVDGVCGTSSGALAGSLWAAGVPSETIAERLSERAPIWSARLHLQPWRGLLSLRHVVKQLRDWLPATFEELPRPFAVGVRAPDGSATLLDSGPLPEAVAASCAIPGVFAPIQVMGVGYQDGGVVDRTGLSSWESLRGERPTLLHLVQRSAKGVEPEGQMPQRVQIVRTARSGASLWNLGDFSGQMEQARRSTSDVLGSWRPGRTS